VLTACSGDSEGAGGGSAATDPCVDYGEPIEGDTKLYIEHNATDEDTGVHGLLGHDGLSEVCLRMPDGTKMMLVDPGETFGDLGIADFFFESREPPADEYSIAELQADFPEGEYRYSGIHPAGTAWVATAQFTHDIPAAPVITEPELAEEEDAGDVTLQTTGLVVHWDPVTETLDGAALTVPGYEVIVTQVEHDDPHGRSRPVYDVHVPADRTELDVVDGFLEPDTVYELEVLALEESGNQTISLGASPRSREGRPPTGRTQLPVTLSGHTRV
jgi:hypothetical protein